jgi:glucans biosynthesis protein C
MRAPSQMSKSSIAFQNLRGFTILLVVAFHSSLAYLASNPAVQAAFSAPPYAWKAIPIIDSARWIGFDVFCASLYVFLMQFMFLLSGLFVWPSLRRKGAVTFLYDRLWRLGLPFLLGVYGLMPLAHYPVYRLSAADASWSAFWAQWMSLPFWPSGQLWFLWCLLALNLAAAALYRAAPDIIEHLGRLSATGKERPFRYFLGLLAASGIAYLPLSFFFQPWDWTQFGPFAFQSSYLLLYVVYFFAGVGIGAFGLDAGVFREAGKLTSRWPIWAIGAFSAFVLWIIPTALARDAPAEALPGLQFLAAMAFLLSSTTACFALAAFFLRFATAPSRGLSRLSANAYGIYVFHYLFVIWLQYLLLGLPLFAVVKFVIVFAASLMLSWAATAAISGAVQAARLLPGASPPIRNRTRGLARSSSD